ncbi:hypothetical protein Tco_1183786 [Tanacetum coccineum]
MAAVDQQMSQPELHHMTVYALSSSDLTGVMYTRKRDYAISSVGGLHFQDCEIKILHFHKKQGQLALWAIDDSNVYYNSMYIQENEATQLYGANCHLPTAPKEKKSGKRIQKTTELENISEADLTEAEQLKIVTKRSRQETHSSHASGSGADEGELEWLHTRVSEAPEKEPQSDNEIEEQMMKEQDARRGKIQEIKAIEAVNDTNTDLDVRDKVMTNVEDTHVTLTSVNPDGQQQVSFHKFKDLVDGADDDEEPSAEQTDGPKEGRSERNPLLPVVHVKRQPRLLPSPDHAWNTSVPAVHETVQPWLSSLAQQDPRESFDELTDSTFDFSAFVLNRLNVQTLTPELLAGPTFELMKGTCKSLTELEYFCEEVYKATTEKLDWINPEGRQYPHDLRQPLPLVPNSQGRRVIPFHHFINNDLEYLRGGVSSRKYSTSVTKTKAADYGHIKWIEDLVPNSMWSQTIVKYDKFALWGISHWGKKRRQFYAFATLRESARDVYSKRRIIAVTKVEIVEWHDYKHLDWITVRRDDDVLYKFKEGDFHRLRIQDIEDMLLLLVQGKVTNLSVEERIAFNVSLRMFTRRVVIQRRVEDLQLGVESYQKKLNLTKPDTYRSNLRRQDAYTPYSDPRGFIYENKDKKNRLMRIDELHKFSDGTLDDVRTALNDRLKGIRMEYLPETFWSQRDKANARAMIQAIDKRLKTRRIMRSLERFVGGRPYGGDLRLLQRTI